MYFHDSYVAGNKVIILNGDVFLSAVYADSKCLHKTIPTCSGVSPRMAYHVLGTAFLGDMAIHVAFMSFLIYYFLKVMVEPPVMNLVSMFPNSSLAIF